jgi:flagellum-specific ATP synthase
VNDKNTFRNLTAAIGERPFADFYGRVAKVRRDSVRTFLPGIQVGALCEVKTSKGNVPVEIISLDPEGHIAMPLDDLNDVQLGDRVFQIEESARIAVGPHMLGKVVDSMGRPYEGNFDGEVVEHISLYGEALNPMDRQIIKEPLDLGVRAVNACLTCGKGQRQGIFAGSGVGKSVLLGMMARYTSADVVVIGLIGERGREVREFIESELGPEGLKKSVIVVETADKSAVRRARGAHAAAAIAEYFRKQGNDVLLMMDSLTRFAMAQREIGIAAGEPPTTKGYTPSVFSSLSRLVERAGNWGAAGSITGLYTVLVEGDDLEDPVSDAARAILDGHIVLSRKLANRGQYPAIDLLPSISRVMDQIVNRGHSLASRELKQNLAKFQENEDAIQYGMYQRGSDLEIDECIEREPLIKNFLRQDREERATYEETERGLLTLFQKGEQGV